MQTHELGYKDVSIVLLVDGEERDFVYAVPFLHNSPDAAAASHVGVCYRGDAKWHEDSDEERQGTEPKRAGKTKKSFALG